MQMRGFATTGVKTYSLNSPIEELISQMHMWMWYDVRTFVFFYIEWMSFCDNLRFVSLYLCSLMSYRPFILKTMNQIVSSLLYHRLIYTFKQFVTFVKKQSQGIIIV